MDEGGGMREEGLWTMDDRGKGKIVNGYMLFVRDDGDLEMNIEHRMKTRLGLGRDRSQESEDGCQKGKDGRRRFGDSIEEK